MSFTLMVTICAVAFVFLMLLAIGYCKAPPDMAYIISGLRRRARIIIGKAAIRIPFFERLDRLPLKLIKIDVKTRESVPTAEFINVNVDAVVTIKVSSEPGAIAKASENFLNKDEIYISSMVTDVLEGNIREIIGTMQLESMISDRQSFAQRVQENAVPDMAKMGIEIVSFNVQSFSDENNLIVDLGIDNTTKIKKNAAIVRAESERDVAIAQAKAKQEANDAQVSSETDIAERQNQLSIRVAELKKLEDTKNAEADAAYDIQKQEQRKTIEIKSSEADIARQEKMIELRMKEVQVKEQALDAEIKKTAEADRYATQQRAEADLFRRQKDAEAKKFEAEQEALALKAKAEADKFAQQQQAIGVETLGKAEATAIKAKGQAEAEAMEKKAEAYQKYTGAAVLEMVVGILPAVAEQVATPLSRIDRISIIGGDGANGVDSLASNVPAVMAKTMEAVKEATGIDMAEIIKANSLEAKVTRNVNVTGLKDIDE